MNIDELSSALQEEADGLQLAGVAPQLPGVRSRVQAARRRRRTTAAAIGAVAIGVAATWALGLPDITDRDPAPVAPVHVPVYGPPSFPAHVVGYHLVASRIGERGDSRISLTVQKPSGRFTIVPACSGPHGVLDTKLVVNGTWIGGIRCSGRQDVAHQGWAIEDLTGNGVDLASKSLTIRLTLVRGRFHQEQTSNPSAVLGLAVYQRDQHR